MSLRLANCAGDIIELKCTRRHNVHSLFLSLSYSGGTTIRHDRAITESGPGDGDCALRAAPAPACDRIPVHSHH
ncbi:unnamed protein product, partial [Brenthis ino]